jgi:hypothetical protein
MATVGDLAVESQIAAVEENAQLHGWEFERIGPRCFRVSLPARNGDIYQLEVEYKGFPAEPAAFHWRNIDTGALDQSVDAPQPYDFFHKSGRICAPWNRLASEPGGPHLKWVRANWQQESQTKGTITLAAMVLRIHHELRSVRYQGRRQ